jgi:hypothetical protein
VVKWLVVVLKVILKVMQDLGGEVVGSSIKSNLEIIQILGI